jgi:hypothetical protein
VFTLRNRARRGAEPPARPSTPAGRPLVARCGDLWLVSSGPGLVLLVSAGDDRAAGHRRASEAAEHLRCELFDHLTVAPFVDPVVVVEDDVHPTEGEVRAGALRHLVLPGPASPLVAQVAALIEGGCLSLPWHRQGADVVAG